MIDKYKITPLKWHGKIKEEYDSISAGTPFGNYTIALQEHGRLTWSYCFNEYYDEDSFDCESIKDGKDKARNHWVERLSGALTKIV